MPVKFHKVHENTRKATQTCMENINGTYGPSGPTAPSIQLCENILMGIIGDSTQECAFLIPLPVMQIILRQRGWHVDVPQHVRRAPAGHISWVWYELATRLD
jgi:hypothetical protein